MLVVLTNSMLSRFDGEAQFLVGVLGGLSLLSHYASISKKGPVNTRESNNFNISLLPSAHTPLHGCKVYALAVGRSPLTFLRRI